MSFAESFWGEKHNGFEVIYQNFKEGISATKDFEDFVVAVCSIYEAASNSFKKMASVKSGSSNPNISFGTYTPLSFMLKTYADHMSTGYGETTKRLQELLARVHKYAEQQKDRQKQVRNSESPTEQIAKSVRDQALNLQRCRDEYHRRSSEFDRARRADVPPAQREIEKLEARVKKTADDYRHLIEKYNTTRDDFERKMKDSCKRLQEIEEAHVDQMKAFIDDYFEVAQNAQNLISKAEKDSQNNMVELTKEKLIGMFIKTKSTGSDIPPAMIFEEAGSSPHGANATQASSSTDSSKVAAQSSSSLSIFNFRKKGNKQKEQDDSSTTNTSNDVEARVDDPSQSRQNEAPEAVSDLLVDFTSAYQSWEDTNFGPSSFQSNSDRISGSNNDTKKRDRDGSDDDSSFDSDSDDSVTAFRQIRIKDKSEVAGGSLGNPQDISQIMRGMTLNLVEPLENKKKTKTKTNQGLQSELTGDESWPSGDSLTPNGTIYRDSFDPLFSSPSPPAPPKTNASSDSLEILSLFAAMDVPPPQPAAPPPVAERRPVTPKQAPSVGSSVAPPSIRANVPPPVPPPPPERSIGGAPPPPPARVRLPPEPNGKTNSEKLAHQASADSLSQGSAQISSVTFASENKVPENSRYEARLSTPRQSENLPMMIKPKSLHGESVGGTARRSSAAVISPPQIRTEKPAPSVTSPSFLQPRQTIATDSPSTVLPTAVLTSQLSASSSQDDPARQRSDSLENSKGLKVSGRLSMSFSSDFAKQMEDLVREGNEVNRLHPLSFRISPIRKLQFHHHKQLLSQMPSPLSDSVGYRFEMRALAHHLAELIEEDRSKAQYNIDILKYKLRPENCTNLCPLAISYRWQQAFGSEAPAGKAAALHIIVRHRGPPACPALVKNPTVSIVLEKLTSVVAKPAPSQFDKSSGLVVWLLPDLTPSSPDYVIAADLRFSKKQDKDRSVPQLSVTFDGEGHLFSALKCDLVSIAHYRLAQHNKRFKSGRYEVEPDD